MRREFLSTDYINRVREGNPSPLNELGEFVFYRTYSRWMPEQKRREQWHETCRRVVEFSIGLEAEHKSNLGIPIDWEQMRREAEEMFLGIYTTRVFCSGRTLWVGGANERLKTNFALGNYNCAFLNITKWEDLGDLFYLLMVGAGVGFKCTLKMAEELTPIRNSVKLLHSEYKPVKVHQRREHTDLNTLSNGFAKIFVGDSKEGWVQALQIYFDLLTNPDFDYIHTIKISYNSVRPKGERLKTFGGTASGHSSLQDMFIGIDNVLKNQIDPWIDPLVADENGYVKVRPIHILDIGNLIGNNVVVGGVRRTAEMFLFDPEDTEVMFAKYGKNGFWTDDHLKHHEAVKHALGDNAPEWMNTLRKIEDPNDWRNGGYFFDRNILHRSMSNNSAAFIRRPTRDQLHLFFLVQQLEGDPNFVNLEAARKRRNNVEGLNPCGEVLLDSKGVCNLCTQVISKIAEIVMASKASKFGRSHIMTALKEELNFTARIATRMSMRLTLLLLEKPEWNHIQQRDRLLGVSMTGIKDAVGLLNLTKAEEMEIIKYVRQCVNDEAITYAKELRIPTPLLCTTLKPEGTLSQVAGGVSSGNGYQKYPYFIRRIRINADDPLAKVALDLGWGINPEVGTMGETYEERMKNARIWVVDFPVHSTSSRFESDVSVVEQLENYFDYATHYTDHNPSNTITVKAGEWGIVEETIWRKWDEFIGMAFLTQDGGTYQLMPYEQITEQQYNEMCVQMGKFDPALLEKYEVDIYQLDEIQDADCANGVCPIK